MANQETKRKLIDTTKKMLLDGMEVEKVTAREIAKEAEISLAMINYCFKSKDELLKISVDEIVREEFDKGGNLNSSDISVKEQLKQSLLNTSKVMIKYMNLTKASIPYLILNDEINLPFEILPFVEKYFGNEKSDKECRIIAFQVVYILQLIFYRLDDFFRYSGMDIKNINQLEELIDLQLSIVGIS